MIKTPWRLFLWLREPVEIFTTLRRSKRSSQVSLVAVPVNLYIVLVNVIMLNASQNFFLF